MKAAANSYKIFFDTLGCRLNHSETAIIANTFFEQGHSIVEDEDQADLCVLNTCTVTEKSDAKCRQRIRSMQKKNPQAWIAVIGCYSQLESDRILSMGGVHIILGNQEKLYLYRYFRQFIETGETLVYIRRIDKKAFIHPSPVQFPLHARANLKIQDGCNFACAFCIIPFARGRARPRVWQDILAEAEQLANNGYKEVILTGVNIGTYYDATNNFMDLIDALEKIDGITRVRISSIEPTTIGREVFDYMRDSSSKLVPFLHLPLQSGSDEILRAMKRRYDLAEYSSFIEEAYEQVPDICIGTDVIVGFPGESEAMFESTMKALEDLPIHFFHIFPFSVRKGTVASRMDNPIDKNCTQERTKILRELSQRKKADFYTSQLGKEKELLLETCISPNYWLGYTDNYVRTESYVPHGKRNKLVKVRLDTIKNQLVQASAVNSQ